MLEFAKMYAAQDLKIQREKVAADRQRDLFEQELKKAEAEHRRRMQTRLWLSQLIGTIGGLLCIGGLILVGLKYAGAGSLGAGAALFGLGSGLTAGIYGVGRYIDNRRQINADAEKEGDDSGSSPN